MNDKTVKFADKEKPPTLVDLILASKIASYIQWDHQVGETPHVRGTTQDFEVLEAAANCFSRLETKHNRTLSSGPYDRDPAMSLFKVIGGHLSPTDDEGRTRAQADVNSFVDIAKAHLQIMNPQHEAGG